jgi:hypothetical protein
MNKGGGGGGGTNTLCCCVEGQSRVGRLRCRGLGLASGRQATSSRAEGGWQWEMGKLRSRGGGGHQRRVGRWRHRGLKVGGGGWVGEAEVEEGAIGEVRDNEVLRGWGQVGDTVCGRGRGR